MVLRRTYSLWKLGVLAIALTPPSIASKPWACQSRQHVRADAKRQKPPFAHRMYFFLQRHADLRVSSCSLLNHAHVAIISYFSCLCLLCHFRFALFAPRDNSFRFQAYTQHPLAFRILQLSDVGRTVIVLNCVLQFFARFPRD